MPRRSSKPYLQTNAAAGIQERMFGGRHSLHAPQLLGLEVLQVLRCDLLKGELSKGRGLEAIEDFRDLPILRYPHAPFVHRIWELRESVTAYDAAYLALAESLMAPLLTHDRRLTKVSGHHAEIEVC